MTRTKHPTNRYERLLIKEIKDATIKGKSGSLRRRAKEAETAQELDHELREIQVCD